MSFRDWNEEGFAAYWDDFESIFGGLASTLKLDGRLVVELSNIRDDAGAVTMLAFEGAQRLAKHYEFSGDIARCNTGKEPAGPGYEHAYLLVYQHKRSVDGGREPKE
jgi:hypothetical protein